MILLNEGHGLVVSPLSANTRMRRLQYSPAASVPVTGSTGDASSVICPSVPSYATPWPVTGTGGMVRFVLYWAYSNAAVSALMG